MGNKIRSLIDSIENRVAMMMDTNSLNLNKGATEDQITSAQECIGFLFSEELKEVYFRYNGQCGRSPIFLGITWLSLQDICYEYTEWQKIVNDGVTNSILDEWSTSYPPEAIQLRYSSEGWIPLFTDNVGNFIGIDYNPGKTGVSGQIINFGRDQEHKYVIATSLTKLLDKVLFLMSEKIYVSLDKDEKSIRVKDGVDIFSLISNGYFE